MTSPTKGGSDAADDALKDSENEAQVDSNPGGREPGIANSQEHAVPQFTENNELDAEKNQEEADEDLKEGSQLIQIPIPRKWLFLMAELGRLTHWNIPLVNVNESNPLINRARVNSGEIKKERRNIYFIIVNYKIPFQFLASWKIPCTSRQERRRMFLRKVCQGHFSQLEAHRNAMWLKQKYIAFIRHPDSLTHGQRAIIFRRPLMVHYYYSFNERIALRKMSKIADAKRKELFHRLVRAIFSNPQILFENIFNKRVGEDFSKSYHQVRVMVTITDDGWKYMCPFCGTTFDSLEELRTHSCGYFGN